MDLMKNRDDDAIEVFRCRFMRRAAYRDRYKLITVGDEPDELFDVLADPGETKNLIDEHPDQVADLANALTRFAQRAEERRPANWEAARQLSLEDDALADRLRALGYLE
jgi:arylsulfatase A-like enzyme